MKDKLSTLILLGIFICLVIIAFRPRSETVIPVNSQPNVTVNSGDFIQISPNLIGIKDNGTHTGIRGQLLVFKFKEEEKSFEFMGSLNYEEYINHPEKYGIEIRK